jgi:hypothetical protein
LLAAAAGCWLLAEPQQRHRQRKKHEDEHEESEESEDETRRDETRRDETRRDEKRTKEGKGRTKNSQPGRKPFVPYAGFTAWTDRRC